MEGEGEKKSIAQKTNDDRNGSLKSTRFHSFSILKGM